MLASAILAMSLAKANFQYAYDNLAFFLNDCAKAQGFEGEGNRCVAPRELELVKAILANQPAEHANPGQLQFRSERAEPGFFMLDGAVRIAKTPNQVGGTIYVNEDFLDDDFDLHHAVAVLTHEMGHHLPESNARLTHEELDFVGARVRAHTAALAQQTIFPGDPLDPEPMTFAPRVLILNTYFRIFDTSRFLLIDHLGIHDVTEQLRQSFHCPNWPTGSRNNPYAYLDGFRFENLFWDWRTAIDTHGVPPTSVILSGRGDAWCRLNNQESDILIDELEFSIELPMLRPGPGIWEFGPRLGYSRGLKLD